jgi:hypothetical protein
LDHRRFDVLFSRLCAIGAKVEPLTLENATFKGMWFGPQGFFLLPPAATAEYQQLITDILRESDWEQKFSRQYLSNRLRPVLENYHLAGEAAARDAMTTLTADLAAFDEAHTVYLPLLGVTLDDAPRREIAGIILHRATDEFLKSITTRKPRTISNGRPRRSRGRRSRSSRNRTVPLRARKKPANRSST